LPSFKNYPKAKEMKEEMKEKNNFQTHIIAFFVIFLFGWSIAAGFLFLKYCPGVSLLGIALNFFILVISITNLFSSAPWFSFILSAVIYSSASYSLVKDTQTLIITLAVGVVVLLVTTALSYLTRKQLDRLKEKFGHLKQAIDSLLVYDDNTSLMHWRFATQALSTEVLRSHRYGNVMSLMLMDVQQKDTYPTAEIERIYHHLGEIIQETVRSNIDLGFISERIGVILPETGISGARVLGERLQKSLNQKLEPKISIAIVSFPDDAASEDDLIRKAEETLQTALISGNALLSYQGLFLGQPESEMENKEKTQPVDVSDQIVQEDYASLLENINLNEDEWLVWIEGVNQMDDLLEVEKQVGAAEHIRQIDLQFLQANHLVVKIQTSDEGLAKRADPFPGWRIKKAHLGNHYLLIAKT